jgi:hypothetical protein
MNFTIFKNPHKNMANEIGKEQAIRELFIMESRLSDILADKISNGLNLKNLSKLEEQRTEYVSILRGTSHLDDEDNELDRAISKVSDLFDEIELEEQKCLQDKSEKLFNDPKTTHIFVIDGLGEYFALNN